MKTRLIPALLLLIIPLMTLPAQPMLQNSLLWRISGKGLENPSYLYGTIHLICPQDYVLRGQTIEAMNRCRRIAFEMDLMNKQEMTLAAQQLINQNPDNYKRWLGEKNYEQVRRFMATTAKIPDTAWTKVRPVILSRRLITRAMNCIFPTGAEQVVMGISRRDNDSRGYQHEFAGLETTADREKLQVFPVAQDSLIAQSVFALTQHWKEFQSILERLAKLYKSEDIVGMENLSEFIAYPFTQAESKQSQQQQSVIIDDRNRLWLPRMEKMMLEKPTFFAVGAGHLAGKVGLITLLRKQGYNLEPITKREQVLNYK
jgi:uncharacterized protein